MSRPANKHRPTAPRIDCSSCGATKPRTDFYRVNVSRYKDMRDSLCIECRKAHNASRGVDSKLERRNRERVRAAKESPRYCRCGTRISGYRRGAECCRCEETRTRGVA